MPTTNQKLTVNIMIAIRTAQLNLSFLTAKAKRFQEAVQCYTKAVDGEPENPVFYSNRASAFMMQEEFSSGLKDAQQATLLAPQTVKVRTYFTLYNQQGTGTRFGWVWLTSNFYITTGQRLAC